MNTDEIKELTGVKMLVWDEYESKAMEREVIGKINSSVYPIVTVTGISVCQYKYAKPLPKPWEVAPEGYRLVTDEEREGNECPSNGYSPVMRTGKGSYWRVSCGPDGWNSKSKYQHSDNIFAVPKDFSFTPSPKAYTPDEVMDILKRHAGGPVVITEGK